MTDDTSPNPLTPGEPALPGEWLFKVGAEVFGPVSGAALVAMIWEGRAGPETPVSRGDGAWRPLAEVPAAVLHLRKVEARARVAAERSRARRGALLRRVAGGAAVLALVAAVSWTLATRPWGARPDLLDDLGPGLELGPVHVGSGSHASDEIAVPDDVTGQASRALPRPAATGHPREAARATGGLAAAPAAPGRSPRGALAEGDLVLAQYDVRSVEQAVARQRGSLAPCLREEAHRSPDFTGEIPIEFAVGNDGKVAALWVDDPRFKSGPLRDCLLRALATWAFDPFPGQRPVVSLSFRIGAR